MPDQTIKLINFEGNGMAVAIPLDPNMTIAQLFERESLSLSRGVATVNGQPATPETPVNPGDRVTYVPSKQGGGH